MSPKKANASTRKGGRKQSSATPQKAIAEKLLKDMKAIAEKDKLLKDMIPQVEIIKDFSHCFLNRIDDFYEKTLPGRISETLGFFYNESDKEKNFRELYKKSQEESKEIEKALDAIYAIRRKRYAICTGKHIKEKTKENIQLLLVDMAKTAPQWVGIPNEMAPPMCGAVPPPENYKMKINDFVAAFVVIKGTDNEDIVPEIGLLGSWILASVSKVYKKNENYKVTDVEGTEYEVYKKQLIPLPLYIADPKSNPDAIYPKNSLVLALYRDTTSFYPAIVISTPEVVDDTYKIRFRDFDYNGHWGKPLDAAQFFTLPYKDASTLEIKK